MYCQGSDAVCSTCPIYSYFPIDVDKWLSRLNPALFGGHVTYFEPHHRLSKYDIKEECRALRDCVFSGRTPQFLDCASEVQDHTGVFPGGYLHVLATRKLPGVPISQLLLQGEVWSLTEDDLQGIKQDLVTTIK